ncbi:hypothetical protein ACGC1H_001974 [Rhizoctonia solani]
MTVTRDLSRTSLSQVAKISSSLKERRLEASLARLKWRFTKSCANICSAAMRKETWMMTTYLAVCPIACCFWHVTSKARSGCRCWNFFRCLRLVDVTSVYLLLAGSKLGLGRAYSAYIYRNQYTTLPWYPKSKMCEKMLKRCHIFLRGSCALT